MGNVLKEFPKRITRSKWAQCDRRTTVPKVITFDAYNTLYATTFPVMEQYALVAKKYDIHVDPTRLSSRFPKVFKDLKNAHPNYGKHTGITALQWWSILIKDLFEPIEIPKKVIEDILDRFSGSRAYAVYEDVLSFVEYIKCHQEGIVLGIISNTDPLVYDLLKNLGLLEYFDDNIFLSYDIELSKPDSKLFDYVLNDIISRYPHLTTSMSQNELKRRCWHVGDELKNDLQATKDAGWNGVLIDRSDKYGFFDTAKENVPRGEHLLSLDKIDNNYQSNLEAGLKQQDCIQTSDTAFVVANFSVLREILFPGAQ